MGAGNNSTSMHTSFRFLPFGCCSSSSSATVAGYLGISDKRLAVDQQEMAGAIHVFPDSPRISFSHDLSQLPADGGYIRVAPASIDFDFCALRDTFNYEPSSADELFSDGKILPVQIKNKIPTPPAPPPPPPSKNTSVNDDSKSRRLVETTEENTKSFWRFRRSSSLNSGGGHGHGHGGTLCPLPLLSRSYSTGSTATGKRASGQKQQQNLKNQQKPTSGAGYYYSRPPLRKNNLNTYNYGVKFNPVLNVPPANLFGLGSMFSGKSKKKN